MPKATQTILEIDLTALGHNYRYIQSQLKQGSRIMAVVKAFGYGSEDVAVAKELEKLGVTYFAVAYAQEGARLREGGIQTPILVLHPQAINFDTILDKCLEPCMYSSKILEEFIAFAQKKKQKQTQVKEIKLRPGTEEGDYQVKLRNLIRFLENGDKAKVTIRYRGRERAHQEIGMEQLMRIETELEEYATVEQRPKMEGRQMMMVLAPKKRK